MLDVTLCCLCQTAVRVRRVRCDPSCCLCQTAVRRVRCDLVLFVPDCSEGEMC